MKYHGINRLARYGDIVQITDHDHTRYLWVGRIEAMSILNESGITVKFGNGESLPMQVADVQFVDRPKSPPEEN